MVFLIQLICVCKRRMALSKIYLNADAQQTAEEQDEEHFSNPENATEMMTKEMHTQMGLNNDNKTEITEEGAKVAAK